MQRGWAWVLLVILVVGGRSLPGASADNYVKPELCQGCHQSVWDTYKRTGMGRSLSRPDSASIAKLVEDFTRKNTYYHLASNSYFSMLQRDGKLYQKRYQLDLGGQPVNVMEKQVDYIMGSGNHARTYLNRTARGTLIELPLAWYAEKGGYWAMNPGYDRVHHDGFRRPITYDCMFCHNGYPQIPAGNERPFAEPIYTSELPQGIDCQRCHGPGGAHVQAASKAGAAREEIRRTIVNPARLSPARQMEVCMACHLESTSFPLPNAIQRYERGPFSYSPGEALSRFILNFDHAAGTGHDDKFELVSAAYRMRRSACFLKSEGKLGCTTCHNPHDIPHGEEAERHYTAVCRQCHAASFDRLVAAGQHTRADGCTGCHMPARRTEDVVHAVVTDHYIQRRKPTGDLLAERAERQETEASAYHGRVAPYYPEELTRTPENDLYLAIAQVKQQSNLSEGIRELEAAIQKHAPARAEFYFELAEALRESGNLVKAVPVYEAAVRRDPQFVPAMQKLGFTLRLTGREKEAAVVLKRAVSLAPENAGAWLELGLAHEDAQSSFEHAIAADPELPEAHNNLGILWSTNGKRTQAEAAFREAIRIQPDYADAHGNLANLLSGSDALRDAIYHFEIALRLQPKDAMVRYNYAMALGRTRRFDQARRELETCLVTDPGFADAHELLADLLMAQGQTQEALPHYREAVRIQHSDRDELGLGSALAATGDVAGAKAHLQKAAAGSDADVREEAAQMLKTLSVPAAHGPPRRP